MSEAKVNRFDTQTLREYPGIGAHPLLDGRAIYRVRLLKDARGAQVLDVREHWDTDSFSGFTRRGIRIRTRRDAASLMESLKQLLEDELLPLEAPKADEA